MKSFRKYEVWKDYWCFEPVATPDLHQLEILDYYCWRPKENKEIKIRIESDDDLELPTKKQIVTYEFILGNQEDIFEGIWNYYRNLILPVYKAATDIEEDEIANSKLELSKVFGIKAIEIPSIDEYESVYFLIEFDFRYDCEHGLYLLFRNQVAIDIFSEGDKNYDAITIYQKGLYNRDQTPLRINITRLNGDSVVTGQYFFGEEISFDLPMGAYRIFYTINDSRRVRNFIVKDNKKSFTLEYVLRNCEVE